MRPKKNLNESQMKLKETLNETLKNLKMKP